jgi:hypothetical protein
LGVSWMLVVVKEEVKEEVMELVMVVELELVK